MHFDVHDDTAVITIPPFSPTILSQPSSVSLLLPQATIAVGFTTPIVSGGYLVTTANNLPVRWRHARSVPIAIPVSTSLPGLEVFLFFASDGSLTLGTLGRTPLYNVSAVVIPTPEADEPALPLSFDVYGSSGAYRLARPLCEWPEAVPQNVRLQAPTSDFTQIVMCQLEFNELYFSNDVVGGVVASVFGANPSGETSGTQVTNLYVVMGTQTGSGAPVMKAPLAIYKPGASAAYTQQYFRSAVISINPTNTSIIVVTALLVQTNSSIVCDP